LNASLGEFALIEALTFDFWNTLFVAGFRASGQVRQRWIKKALQEAGYSEITDARVEGAIHRAWKEWDHVWEQEQHTFGAARWVALVLADLGVSPTLSERDTLIRAMERSGLEVKPPLIDGLDTMLPRLAQRYRLAVICDTGLSPGWMLRQWMEGQGILRHFSHLTFSDELGVSKPHPDMFLTTLAALGVHPEAAVHIGDYPRTDVAGAQGVGMRTIRFAGVFDWEDGAARAEAKISSYRELEPLLDEWTDE
jgi:putative hydrolase of the HAD superfamily